MSYSQGLGGGGRGNGGRGRGEYYKNRYGSGGRQRQARDEDTAASSSLLQGQRGGGSYEDLRRKILSIDGRQYPCYHDLETPPNGGWVHSTEGSSLPQLHFTLEIGRAQSDPFAPPTRCRVTLPRESSQFPMSLWSNKIRRIAFADYLWRALHRKCKEMRADQSLNNGNGGGWSGPKGGDIQVMEPTQHVLEQTAVSVDSKGNIKSQLTVNLPASGRSILGSAALHILNKVLPQLVLECLVVSSHNLADINQHVDSVEDQAWLQGQLEGAGLVAFVRNGAILPRSSGIDDRPMSHQIAIPFQSPSSLQVSFTLPNAGTSVSGMGIRKGITLICGGGFHGKSTLLEALQLAVYYKIPGDGREFCVSSVKSVKIRAEDGRCVTAVDISSFIKNLPFGKDTSCFTTSDASGSTSQAANIVEVRYYPLAMKYCYFRRCCMLNERVQLFIQCVWPPRWTFFPG
jgi:predicted ABC-class ATPase